MTREVAFSNGTQGYGWMANWCDRCLHDAIFQNTGKGSGCPIIASVMCDNTVPPEWYAPTEEDEIFANYTCIEFKPRGWRDPEPKPKPDPQPDALFPTPERQRRMLVQPVVEPQVVMVDG